VLLLFRALAVPAVEPVGVSGHAGHDQVVDGHGAPPTASVRTAASAPAHRGLSSHSSPMVPTLRRTGRLVPGVAGP